MAVNVFRGASHEQLTELGEKQLSLSRKLTASLKAELQEQTGLTEVSDYNPMVSGRYTLENESGHLRIGSWVCYSVFRVCLLFNCSVIKLFVLVD